MREHLIRFYHIARIAGFYSRHERLQYAAREWAKLAPGEFMLAYKLVDKMTRQPEVAYA